MKKKQPFFAATVFRKTNPAKWPCQNHQFGYFSATLITETSQKKSQGGKCRGESGKPMLFFCVFIVIRVSDLVYFFFLENFCVLL